MRKLFDSESAKNMYITQQLTVREIGKVLSVSGPAVWYALKSMGVKSKQGEWVTTTCAQCGISTSITRSKWRRNTKNYCSENCRVESMGNPAYLQNRHSQREARRIVSKYFDLLPSHIVHHEDSNTENNALDNLRVFKSQAEHMSYERGGKARPIWDGAARP